VLSGCAVLFPLLNDSERGFRVSTMFTMFTVLTMVEAFFLGLDAFVVS
jgi:hypothetical protein